MISKKSAEESLAAGFQDVDSGNQSRMLACLDFMQGLQCFRSYKQQSLRSLSLQPGDTVLDVGCGPGDDLARVAELVGQSGRAIGIDQSTTLIAEANRRHSAGHPNACFAVDDAAELRTVAAGSVDACRVDRVLQHVADPSLVLRRMVSVLRPGGRLVCCEPDWGTFTLLAEDVATAQDIAADWTRHFRNPWMGRQLKQRLMRCGLEAVQLTGHLLFTDGYEAADRVFDVAATVERLQAHDPIARERYSAWLERYRSAQGCSASVTLFMVSALKPK